MNAATPVFEIIRLENVQTTSHVRILGIVLVLTITTPKLSTRKDL